MYTFSPIAAVDTVNNHGGILLTAVIVIFAVIIMSIAADRGEKAQSFFGYFFFGTVVVGISAVISFNTGTITTYKNEPVTATFVSFQPEGYNEEQRNGKFTSRVDVHKMYVVYTVDGQNVILPAVAGGSYPSTITLFRN